MRSDAEIRWQRVQTDAFVGADAERVEITRQDRVSDGAGGWVEERRTLEEPQTIRLQSANVSRTRLDRTAPTGQVYQATHELVADVDADIEAWDTFEIDGQTYTIIYVDRTRDYVLFGEVVEGGW